MTADHPAADEPLVATRKRNPSWARDELILALDLYLREGQLDAADPSVIELSAVLNALPIHTDRPDREKFRNPNGVAMKLANFAALDPGYPGVGLAKLNGRVRSPVHEDVLRLPSCLPRGGSRFSDW